jgi:hypothetical protein
MGELTGEMGTIATYERSGRFFGLTLARIAPLLREHGHVGYVNLNTIVNEYGIWPLEFTCRFGYPGFAVLEPLQATGWGELLAALARRPGGAFAARPGFSAGIVLTTPPFPYTRKQVDEPVGLPVILDESLDAEDRRHLHYGEVGMAGEQLVTTGLYGWTMVVTGVAATIAAAKRAAYGRAERFFVPGLRYRLDIGDRLIAGDYEAVAGLGLLSDADRIGRKIAGTVDPDAVADEEVVGGQLDPGWKVLRGDVVAEAGAQRQGVGRVAVVEVAAVVAAQDPKPSRLVPGRIGAQEALHVLRQAGEIVFGIDPVDARIETPGQLALANRLKKEHSGSMNIALPQLCFYHQHEQLLLPDQNSDARQTRFEPGCSS